MKIGIVSPYDYCHPGGVTLHISYLARHFLRMGHDVKIVAPCSRHGASYFGEEVIPVGHPVPWPNGGSIARIPISPWLPLQLRPILDREKFDILHIHEPYTPMLALSALCQEAGCPKIATFHAYHTKARGYWIGKPLLLHIQNYLAVKIAVSPAALLFVSRHVPSQYTIIPNGVDTDLFSTTVPPKPELMDGKRNIVFVGRLEKRKGVNYLIEAFSEVKKTIPDSRLVIVGPGQVLRREYEERVRELGLDDVRFIGFVPGAELAAYYRAADVFCAPAIHGESFGIVLLEAMASGAPVVASDIEGYNSVVCHGRDALLVPPRDPPKLAEAIIRMLRDRDLARSLAAAGEVKARDFSWANIAQRVMSCYTNSLDKHRNQQP